MHAGRRTLAHHGIVQCLKSHMSTALWNPTIEAHPFMGHRDIRVDIVTRAGLPREYAVDVATISPWVKSHATKILSDTGGAAATAYGFNNKMHGRYADVLKDNAFVVTPVVAEHLGSWGKPAYRLFSKLCTAISDHSGISHIVVRMRFMSSISVCLQRAVASLLSTNRTLSIAAPLDRYVATPQHAAVT